jgi:hypothetical protein
MEGSADVGKLERKGPVEGDHVMGWDRDPASRPGVPMSAAPSRAEGAPASDPVAQAGGEGREHRAALDGPTPVFGTAQPLHGLSGAIRRAAYRIHEHRARHWMLLMAADRVDVLEDRLGALLTGPLEAVGAESAAGRVRSNPLPYVAGAAAGAALVLVARARR